MSRIQVSIDRDDFRNQMHLSFIGDRLDVLISELTGAMGELSFEIRRLNDLKVDEAGIADKLAAVAAILEEE